MAVTVLVPLAFKNEDKKFHFTIKQNLPPYVPDRVVPSSKKLKDSGIVKLKQRMEAAGIPKKAEKLITNVKLKYTSTQGRYESARNKWPSWRTLRQIDLFWYCKIHHKFVS